MASTSSISGLVSGLDTDALVTSLMQLEAAPQTRLKARVTTEQTGITALQSLNTKLAALTTKAADLAKPATWAAVIATSSNASVSVTTAAGAAPTRLSLTVTSVARTHQLGFADGAALADTVTGASTKVTLDRFDGTPVELETGDGSLQGLVAAINNPANATGLRATALKTSDGYRLLVESTQTGVAEDFDLTKTDGTPLLGGSTVRGGADAALDLGLGITVSSASNTFSDLAPGVTLTLAPDTAIGATSTIDVKRGSTTLGSSVADLVASMNTILAEIDKGTAYDATAKTGGLLGGDPTVRNLRSSLIGTVFSATGESLNKLGINTTRDGKIVFDATAFATAYAANPDATAATFTTAANGFAARVQAVAKTASDSSDGNLTAAITGRRTGVTRLQSSIDSWDIRLASRQEALKRQFTALETAMSQMNSQSSWLSSQIAALPSYSSNK